jgi:hypothetical protein
MSLTTNLFLDRKENTLKRIYELDPLFWTPNLAHQLMNDCRLDPVFLKLFVYFGKHLSFFL